MDHEWVPCPVFLLQRTDKRDGFSRKFLGEGGGRLLVGGRAIVFGDNFLVGLRACYAVRGGVVTVAVNALGLLMLGLWLDWVGEGEITLDIGGISVLDASEGK